MAHDSRTKRARPPPRRAARPRTSAGHERTQGEPIGQIGQATREPNREEKEGKRKKEKKKEKKTEHRNELEEDKDEGRREDPTKRKREGRSSKHRRGFDLTFPGNGKGEAVADMRSVSATHPPFEPAFERWVHHHAVRGGADGHVHTGMNRNMKAEYSRHGKTKRDTDTSKTEQHYNRD